MDSYAFQIEGPLGSHDQQSNKGFFPHSVTDVSLVGTRQNNSIAPKSRYTDVGEEEFPVEYPRAVIRSITHIVSDQLEYGNLDVPGEYQNAAKAKIDEVTQMFDIQFGERIIPRTNWESRETVENWVTAASQILNQDPVPDSRPTPSDHPPSNLSSDLVPAQEPKTSPGISFSYPSPHHPEPEDVPAQNLLQSVSYAAGTSHYADTTGEYCLLLPPNHPGQFVKYQQGGVVMFGGGRVEEGWRWCDAYTQKERESLDVSTLMTQVRKTYDIWLSRVEDSPDPDGTRLYHLETLKYLIDHPLGKIRSRRVGGRAIQGRVSRGDVERLLQAVDHTLVTPWTRVQLDLRFPPQDYVDRILGDKQFLESENQKLRAIRGHAAGFVSVRDQQNQRHPALLLQHVRRDPRIDPTVSLLSALSLTQGSGRLDHTYQVEQAACNR